MNTSSHDQPIIRKIGEDATLRLSLRKGDYLLWVATDSPFNADSESAWTIRDFWQLRDGDFVTMTNRWMDLPVWFELHPLEVAGRAVDWMMKKLAQGFKPGEPMEGPNVWRVKTGDRLVWVSITVSKGHVREIVDFKKCALVLGENNHAGTELFDIFGAPENADPSPIVKETMRKGFEDAVGLGIPRTFSPEWQFGA